MSNTFEQGKRYRTVGGKIMRISYYSEVDQQMHGREEVLDLHGMSLVYKLTGIPKGSGWDEWQLLPGAIEDEEAPGRVPAHERIDELFKLIRSQGECIEVQDNAIGIIDKRIETLTAELSAAMTAGKGQYVELARQMQGIRAKLKAQSDCMAGIDHEGENVKRRLTELDNLTERIRLVADGAHIRLDVLRDKVYGDLPIMTVTQTRPNMAAEPKPMTPFKRTIKGGWMNVYAASPEQKRDLGWRYHFATREEADMFAGPFRTACIQIPDFTEGEGLRQAVLRP